MIIFKLPDLGEGLPDAIIREWYVKPGDKVKTDQPLVAMETAKALVDVPVPFSGQIEKLFGKPGDTIDTGQPLVGFVGENKDDQSKDTGTVVGKIQESEMVLDNSSPDVTIAARDDTSRIKATPAVRNLAKKLGVNLADFASGGARITSADVEQAAQKTQKKTLEKNLQPLSPVRRAMILSMTESHRRVVPITLCDDADIAAWDNNQDITLRLIRATIAACEAVPMLNATFDDENMAFQLNKSINLGIAVDTAHGLYVPVLKDVNHLSDAELRQKIESFKQQAQQKSIAQDDLHGATIILSNFGALAGRYGNPIIIPPMVAIIGVGKARDMVVPEAGKPAIHRIIPLSLSIDHRAVTGGEAAKFLKLMMETLAKAN